MHDICESYADLIMKLVEHKTKKSYYSKRTNEKKIAFTICIY